MPEEMLNKCCLSTWDLSECSPEAAKSFLKMPYSELYSKIQNEIESKGLRTSSKSANNILRVGINSIGSPLWHSHTEETQLQSVIRFLYVLKALLRTSFAVAVITVPSFLQKVCIILFYYC